MILYLDTSALVKLYVEEAGSSETREAVQEALVVASSRVAYVETRAAFARKYRERGITRNEYRATIREVDHDWAHYLILDVSDDLVKLAGSLTESHALRAFDAVHLASAVILRKETGREVTFSCFDRQLLSAARKEGLR